MNQATRFHALGTFTRQWLLPFVFSAFVPAASGQPANVQLPAPAHGADAVTALGAYLPEVAKAYGLDANGLASLFQAQPSLGVDRSGALLFACDGLVVREQGRLVDGGGKQNGPAASGGIADAMTPDSSVTAIANGEAVDAFKLHSLPGVTRVIFLDFDGHTTSGTSWNSSYGGGAPIVSAPFDLDGTPGTFSASERSMIQKIWQRVAEDYAPFGVDVTTEDPGLEGLRKMSSGDNAFGIRVVISPTNWYSQNAGGVAYIGSFNWNTDTPCFCFSQQLANGEKYIAEAASHEVGHTVGLNHDGTSGPGGTQYYEGQGNWAPIMGVGYYKPIVQFSKGEYANANNTQDDLAVITSYVPLAADDRGNTLATATVISGPTVNTGGTIETRSDVDLFRFDAGAGALSLLIKSPGPDTNLDLKAELLDAGGQVVLTSDSTSDLTATLAKNLAAGTYYVRVMGVGTGDPLTTGYSSYGSIGNYLITGSFPTSGVNQPPVAVAAGTPTSGTAPLSVSFTSAGSSDSDGSIVSYAWNFGNMSTATGPTGSTTYNTPGTYSAVLTVVDDGGLAGTDSVVINVAAAPNVPPTAVASGTPKTGMELMVVNFSSAGSSDIDGSVVSYSWSFGDGTTSSLANPSKTYSVAGNYNAQLTVTDNSGASSTSSPVAISVADNPAINVDISQLTLVSNNAKGGSNGVATINVRDQAGPVSGVSISVQWSGVVSGSSTGTTNAAGNVILTSPKTKKGGNVTVTVSSVTPPAGRSYDPMIMEPKGTPVTDSVRLN